MGPARLWIGNTDRAWYEYLLARPAFEEINFWLPGGRLGFRSLNEGEPFLFKLHRPDDFIVGGGFFSRFSFLPISLAWEIFQQQNGVPSEAELRKRVGSYRAGTGSRHEDYTIGCVLLRNPFYLDRKDWLPLSKSWASNLPRGRGYSAIEGEGAALWRQVADRLHGPMVFDSSPLNADREMYGTPTLYQPRLGQGTFRVAITDTYERRCAMTGEKALPVLEAAHIRPVSEGGGHWLPNGLLLRSDLHRLFDRGYVTVTPDLKMHVSRLLREEYGNGEIYYPLEGKTIWTPRSVEAQPSRQFLEWHADSIFKP